MDSKIKVIIPAAGIGRRMKSYGPKGLIDIEGKSVLVRQIEAVGTALEIMIVIGFEAEKVRQNIKFHNVKFYENEYYENTNVAYSIYEGVIAAQAQEVLIIYGDLVFNKETLNNLDFSKSFVLLDDSGQIRDDEVGVFIQDNTIFRFTYAGETKWAQIAYLKEKELKLFLLGMEQKNSDKFFGFELLNFIINNGGALAPRFNKNMRICEIDNAKDICKAKEIYAIPSHEV